MYSSLASYKYSSRCSQNTFTYEPAAKEATYNTGVNLQRDH